MFNVYVYYRLDPRHADDAEKPIRALMARLACQCTVSTQLLKKRGEPRLWMEAYEGVLDPDAFERELTRGVDEYDVGIFIEGKRHLECFQCAETDLPGRRFI